MENFFCWSSSDFWQDCFVGTGNSQHHSRQCIRDFSWIFFRTWVFDIYGNACDGSGLQRIQQLCFLFAKVCCCCTPANQYPLPPAATQELQSLAGNGMHMRAILAAVAIVLKSMDPMLMRNYLKWLWSWHWFKKRYLKQSQGDWCTVGIVRSLPRNLPLQCNSMYHAHATWFATCAIWVNYLNTQFYCIKVSGVWSAIWLLPPATDGSPLPVWWCWRSVAAAFGVPLAVRWHIIWKWFGVWWI